MYCLTTGRDIKQSLIGFKSVNSQFEGLYSQNIITFDILIQIP